MLKRLSHPSVFLTLSFYDHVHLEIFLKILAPDRILALPLVPLWFMPCISLGSFQWPSNKSTFLLFSIRNLFSLTAEGKKFKKKFFLKKSIPKTEAEVVF